MTMMTTTSTLAAITTMMMVILMVQSPFTTDAFRPLLPVVQQRPQPYLPVLHPSSTQLPVRSSSSSSSTQLQYANTPTSSSSSSNSDHERFRQAIAAAAAARSMYYQNEMSIQELDQVRASFELLVQRNHLYYSQTGNSMGSATQQLGLEVYYPEGVIHPAEISRSSSSCSHPHEPSTDAYRYSHSTTITTNMEEIDIEDDTNHHLLLTTAGRRLRELEIQLLESIRTNDDGIDQLVHLWTTERNAESAYALLQMQSTNQVCSQGLVQEEADLATLCRNYPGWAEPWSRLATLLFYKGVARWSDALSAAEEAIRIKPWHFEALNVCTLIQTQMDHPDNPSVIFGDDDSVADLRRRCQRLSRLSLPKLDTNQNCSQNEKDALEARHMWVSRAVATAQHQLQCAEQYTAAFRRTGSRTTTSTTSVAVAPNHESSAVLSAWQ